MRGEVTPWSKLCPQAGGQQECRAAPAEEVGITGTVRLPHHAASAALARRRVGQELRSRHVRRVLVDDVALVLSELVTNSVRHAGPLPGGELEVSWRVRKDAVELRVTDGGGAETPRSQAVGPDEIRGRGLSIVARIAAAWGVETSAVGTTVWAVLALGRSIGGARPHPG